LWLAILICAPVYAQETRSMLFGRVLDPQSSAVVGATVAVTNADTGVALKFTTNDTGYYEANLLLPGQYQVEAEAPGFKKLQRKGITLPVSSRFEIDMKLEVGGVTETISVTADTAMLETNAVSSGRVLDNKTIMELPLMGNSAMLLVKVTPGVQTPGVNNYLALHSNAGGSEYSVGGNVGGNAWTLDGSPNQGPGRRTAYLPYSDAVAEFKVETNNFDAGIGQTSGAAISMISKSGTNALHGTATWQHWQQRWQGTPFFTKQQYYNRINAAEATGNKAEADRLRATDKQPTGRSNNWGASAGGPLVIPKVVNGRNKIFWFFTYNAFKDVKVEDPSTFNRTVPTAGMRDGNFSEMLSLANPTRYIIHDPTTVVADPARPSQFVRTPFPNNIIPKSRFANPAYDAITKLYPMPNNSPAAGQDPVNNYLASQTPYNWDYYAYSNRVDYQISNNWRAFGRWSVNNFGPEDRADWVYETARGLNLNGLVRNNKGGNFDLVYTQNSSTVWDFNIAIDQFREGNIQPKALSYKPSDIGLPAYMDQKAGDQHILPQMVITDYSTISPGGFATWTRTRPFTTKLEMSKVRGNHTVRAAFDARFMYRTGGGGGNTSGNFTFNNQYTRRDSDGNAPNRNLGQAWAAFILGIPSGNSAVATNDNYATFNPYYGWFVQDNWRLNRKLTLNLGLRMEWEGGITERYNRMITDFDPNAQLPITAGAQAAYAASPVPELAAANFKVVGGSVYAGANGAPRSRSKAQLMALPRIGVAYQLNEKTVIRGGYGIFYDTINVLNSGPDQSGYSRSTSNNGLLSTDFGRTWNPALGPNASPANFKSPLSDPFPIRADGTRFDVPTRDALGAMARVGRGFGFTDYEQDHSRQQRWRLGMQRQIGQSLVIDVAYAGSRSAFLPVAMRLDFLPEQYWNKTNTRNDALATSMNANVTNPFRIQNFASLQQSAPLIYQDMTTQGQFTAAVIQKNRLLRVMPQMNNVTNNTATLGYNRVHEFQFSVDKRFSKGFNFNFGYTAMKLREADFFYYEWDRTPTERFSNDGRPHRIVASGVWELPFGRGKRLLGSIGRPANLVLGGWQMATTYEWQPGGLLDFGNVFYRGTDPEDVKNVNRTFDTWFNTADFVRVAAQAPTSFQARTFPTRIGGLRAHSTHQWNANIAKNIRWDERFNVQLRFDALNVLNRSQMAGPVMDPLNSNFGKITSQTSATNRWLQVQMRVTF
jgi:hypothetical protein